MGHYDGIFFSSNFDFNRIYRLTYTIEADFPVFGQWKPTQYTEVSQQPDKYFKNFFLKNDFLDYTIIFKFNSYVYHT